MRERVAWIDRVKGFAMICVVLCHVVNGFNSANMYPASGYVMYSIQNILNSFQMALFCVASGYVYAMVYLTVNDASRREKIVNQIFNLLIMYVFWCLVMGITKIVFSNHVNTEIHIIDLFKIWYKPIGVFWYLYLLIVLYLIFMKSFPVKQKNKILIEMAIMVISVVGALLSDDSLGQLFMIRRISYYLGFFYLGIIYYRKKKHYMIITICGLAVYITLFTVFWNDSRELYHIPVVNLILAVGMSLFIMRCFELTGNIKKILFLDFIGQKSLDIYVWHVFIATALRMLAGKLSINNSAIAIIASAVSCIALPLVIGKVMKKIGIYSYLFKPYITVCNKLKKVKETTYDD